MGSKRGRPRKTGQRTKSGQLSRVGQCLVRDYGNIKVVERRNRFRHFIDDKGLTYEGTSAGRLWIVGAFDGYDIDPQVMRDCLLGYTQAYWGEYPSTSGTANYTQEDRRGSPGGDYMAPDRAGEWFERIDGVLRSCGRDTRLAVHNVTVDAHFFPDEDRDWVSRIINGRVLQRRKTFTDGGRAAPEDLTICGELPSDSDWAMLHLCCLGAVALAQGTTRVEKRSAA